MSDTDLRDLAQRAGIASEWIDSTGKPQQVSIETLRRILASLGLPCDTSGDHAESRNALSRRKPASRITTTVGRPVDLPFASAEPSAHVRLRHEDGTTAELPAVRTPVGIRLPAIHLPGYHGVEFGEQRIALAVAPERCHGISDIAGDAPIWGLAAQLYGLRSAGDCGIGDMAGVAALAGAAASLGADALALSPMHALFAAEPGRFSPYAPSSRLFLNPLHADASALFAKQRLEKALGEAGGDDLRVRLERGSEIDWPRSAGLKLSVFRRLFEDFAATDLVAQPASKLGADFAEFRAAAGAALEVHARFEALHAARLAADPAATSWIGWPAEWRDPHGAAVDEFAARNAAEILFHLFLQWIADRSFAAAQAAARGSGMRLGLIADLAVGMASGGSEAWSHQEETLVGLEIGAPPDLFNANGQNWGLTTFSPHALVTGGFAPFIATLRACMRHAGAVRVDHALGLLRLWVIPRGAPAREGAYLAYPFEDLLRLIALESHRHAAVVVGEDLGTVPAGFQDRLAAAGIYGMRVLWFQRDWSGFAPPRTWPAEAAAMTSTHDLATVAGWWRGRDIEVRAQCGLSQDPGAERSARIADRESLWRAFRAADVGDGPLPNCDEAERVVDAAVGFLARTPSRLALLPLEDALALEDQPNLPGTIDEHPNWRRRYPGEAVELLARSGVTERLAPLDERGER